MAAEQIDGALVLYGCGDVLNDYEGRPDLLSRRGDLGALFVADFNAASLELVGLQRLVIQRQAFCLKLADLADTRRLDARLLS